MSTFPMLNGRPIDQWLVTELKDELQKRNLPITGLKEDLVKRLTEDIQGVENTDGETSPALDMERGAAPGSVNAYVYQDSGERNVDDVSEVMKQGGEARMLTYPMLNGWPIDQWKVTELKDELQQRNLPIAGLKDDLVKRLHEDIQGQENIDGETPLAVEMKRGATLGSVNASVYQDPDERNVDGVSEVMKEVGDVVMSATESMDESLVPTTEASKEHVTVTSESNQRTVDAVTEVEFSLFDMTATDENRCEPNGVSLASSGITIVKELNPHSGSHNDIIEKTSEDDTSRTVVVDSVHSDISGFSIELGVEVERNILETSQDTVIGHAEASQRTMGAVVEAESSLDDISATDENHCQSNGAILESSSSGITAVKEVDPLSECNNVIGETPEDETSTKMVVDGVSSDVSTKLAQEAFIGTAEVSQKTLDVVTEVGSSLVDRAAKATDENHCEIDLESTLIGNTTVKKVNPHSEGQGDTIKKNPEDNTSKKMVVNDGPSDSTNIDTKGCVDDVDMKLLEQEAIPTSPDAILLHADSDADAAAETEECTGKEMVIDDVSSDDIHANANLGVDVDCKSGQEVVPIVDVDCNIGPREVLPPPDAIAPHADNSDADAVATTDAQTEDYTGNEVAINDVSSDVIGAHANSDVDVDYNKEQEVVPVVDADCNIGQGKVPPPSDAIALHTDVVAAAESMILKNSFSENAVINGKDSEDPRHTNGDCKVILCRRDDQVSEVKLDLASQTECVSICHDNVSANKKNNVLGNLNSDNSDLELEAKQEVVNPFFTIPSVGDCLQALDGDKLHKNGTIEESALTSNMDLDTKEDNPDDNSPEKHLDWSPSVESIDEDLMENMHDLGGETKVASEHVFKEVTPVDTVIEGSSGHTMEVVAEEKPPNLTEKRKSEGRAIIANEKQIKRQCQWDVDTVSISGQKTSILTGSGAPKVIWSSAERSFDRSNLTANGDSLKERIIPPPKKPATTSLRIDRFVRPFTLKAAQELLGKTGSISSFWMDQIKTHCYVTYSSVEEAVATRNAVYNLQWPPNNGSCLVAEFVDPQEVKVKLEPPPSPVPINPSTATAPEAATCQPSIADQTIPPRAAATSRGLLTIPAPLAKLPPTDPAIARERIHSSPKNLEPALKLDDLFKKTQAYPRIYYMPLSEEEVLAKNAARGSRRNRRNGKVIKGFSSRT